MTSPLDGKVAPFGEDVDTFSAFLHEPAGDIDTGSGPMPNLRKLANELREIAASTAEESANETALAIEDRIYPGVYSTPPTAKPHSGAPCAEGDRCVILVGGVGYEHLRSGGGWVIPNIDAAHLAAPDGAARIGLNGKTLMQVLESGSAAPEKRPAFVETFVPIHSIPTVPANIATYQNGADPSGNGHLNQFTLTVTSGAVGAVAVTVSESAIVAGIGAGPWPCVIEHADGSHSFNIVTGGSGSTVNLRFALEKAAAILSPLWDSALGQHMTKRGYRGLADLVFGQSAVFCTATQFIGAGCFVNQPPIYQQLFAANAALSAYGRVNVNNIISEVAAMPASANIVDNATCLIRSSPAPCGVTCGAHATGHGVTGSIATNRQRGFIETHVATTSGSSTTPTQRGSATLNAYGVVGGVEYLIYTKPFSDFLERVLIPFDGYESVRLEAVAVSNYAFVIQIMDTKAWLSNSADAPLVGKNSKVVTMGDSWFAFYGTTDGAVSTGLGAFSQRLQDLMRAAGGAGVVVNKAKGGMTTEWALAWFDAYVLPEKPDQVIFNFFTNDANTTSATATFVGPTGATLNNRITDSNHWRANLAKLAAKCERAGIQPIFILPAGTASVGQAQNQMVWRRTLRQGQHVDATPKVLSSELADTASFVNNFGKHAGKPVVVGASIFYAQGPLPSDAWRNTQNERISNLEVQTYDFGAFDKNVAKIGTDTNGDGLSDGVTTQGYGAHGTNTYVPSISAGVQLSTASYLDASGATGNARLKFDFTCVAGRDYFLIAEYKNSVPSTAIEAVGLFFGSAALIGNSAIGGPATTDVTGAATKGWRFNAVTSTAAYFSTVVTGSRASLPVSYVTGVKRVHLIDLTTLKATLGVDVNAMPDAELFALLNAALTMTPPTSLRITDSVTGLQKRIVVNSGVVSVI